jgi:hypothetical protein
MLIVGWGGGAGGTHTQPAVLWQLPGFFWVPNGELSKGLADGEAMQHFNIFGLRRNSVEKKK